MDTKQACRLLQIHDDTLRKKIRRGEIKATKGENGRWDVDSKSVYELAMKHPRLVMISGRMFSRSEPDEWGHCELTDLLMTYVDKAPESPWGVPKSEKGEE